MATKTVYCSFGQRCKKITLSCESQSQLQELTNKLKEIVDRDAGLKVMFLEKTIIFQKMENNKWIDVEEDDEICDGSEFNVVLMENSISEVIIVDESNVIARQFPTPEIPKKSKPASKIKNEPHREVPYPAPLPPLTLYLKNLLQNFNIIEKQDAFINFWATHLESITNGTPTKSDYDNYSRTIVDTYSKLKGGKDGYGIVKSQLSARIRNGRFRLKQKLKAEKRLSLKDSSQSDCSEPKIRKLPSDDNEASLSSCITESQKIENALQELENCKAKDDSNRVKELMQITNKERRTWIENTEVDLTIREIVKKYPQLNLFKLIIFEFLLMTKTDEEQSLVTLSKLLENLGQYFSMDSVTDEEKAKIFKRLYEELTLKKFLKANEPLITITEAEKKSTSELLCAAVSPRLVIYTEDGGIASAFIVADEEIKIKILVPNIQKALLCLLASYYAWNIKYPSGYVNTLTYLDQEVLNNQSHNQSAVHKFTRKMKDKLNMS